MNADRDVVTRTPTMRAMDFGKIFSSVDADDIADVVKLVVENREVIARLGQLPELLDQLGDSLGGAGSEAKQAAVALVGTDGKAGARGILEQTSSALAGIATSLTKGIELINDTAAATHKVPLMDGPATKLEGAARELSESTELLTQLATSMDSIADVLASVGGALDKVGGYLTDTSTQARGFMASA